MYHISLPAMAISPAFDCDKIIADARLVGASRIMLAIDTLSTDKSRMDRYFDIRSGGLCLVLGAADHGGRPFCPADGPAW